MTIELEVLRDEIRDCKLCDLHKAMPFYPVPGIGPSQSDIMIVGEAPGEDEATAEEPFVGLAGKMLDRLLSMSGLQRNNVYICNVVNCRPTEGKKNRPPNKAEIKTCSGWLMSQISIVKPKVIFTLGKVPTVLLLKEKSTMKLHDHVGVVHKIDTPITVDVIPNLHPSYVMQWGRKQIDLAVNVFKMAHYYLEGKN